MKKLLMTGATGFLGEWVIKSLKQEYPSLQIFCISRQSDRPNGVDKVIHADLSNWDAGLSDIENESLREMNFDAILHMAGLYNLRVSLEDAFLHNVYGTHNALRLAEIGKIPIFAHISTVAVTMGHGRLVNSENDPRSIEASIRRPEFHRKIENEASVRPISADQEVRGPFPDHYATTKAESEKLVRNWSGEFPRRRLILRPGILVGDSKQGKIHRIDGPYHAIEAFRRLKKLIQSWPGALILPGHPTRRIPLVPIDFAALAIVRYFKNFLLSDDSSRSYYIAPSNGPTAQELYKSALRHLGLNNEVGIAHNLPDALVKPAAEWLARLPREELEYVLNLPELDTDSSEKELGADFYPTFEMYESALWRGYDGYAQNR